MESKLNYGSDYRACPQTLKKSSDVEEALYDGSTNPYKKTTYTQKCGKGKLYTKYGLIFSGVITIILMVVFGINNVAIEYKSNELNTTNNTSSTIVFVNTTTIPINTTEIVTAPTIINVSSSSHSPKQTLDMLDSQEESDDESTETTREVEDMIDITTEQEGQDVVISNKTVIIDGGNQSIIITH